MALRSLIGSPTIPQVFVGGEYIGGCQETFNAFNEGRLRALMQQHGVAVSESKGLDAYSLLPTWLHPR